MSRTTDTERGARIALDTADAMFRQHDFWPLNEDAGFWASICIAASLQLSECQWAREVMAQA